MNKVSFPEGPNLSVDRYVKGQSILVASFDKRPKLRKSYSKLSRMERPPRSSRRTHQRKQGGKSGSLQRVKKPQPLGRLGRIRELHVRKNDTKNPTLPQKFKELTAEAEDDEDILSDLIN